ncbi:putative beta-adaptin [Ceraceosorus guamensis]|uniref:AP complex subunit beta n=1 Tax=Ceraceosorus guamensis TaxID=1522189 RepID=A0A316VVU4_9BASI|nr:putative beta-adaptin [Ceraceosorus guamensis]PWN40553.1 putative beta-adaptin [Ceraceosorus guamensis]
MTDASGRDGKLFARGKVAELKAELISEKKDKGWVRKRTTLKRIIANATMGNDMSSLFNDVVNTCMAIQVLEIKKMVYLYLINYGRSQPELIPNAIPGFLSDCNDRNPLIRALAIRTMSYIHVPVVISALLDPLRQSLRDSDPYVRKTAAICVAKLYMHDRKVVDRQGLIGMLRDLLADTNPTVVANAVAALTEISERSDNIQLKLNLTIASKLVSALPDCSEWGQTYILESLMFFVPQDYADAEILAERIAVRLQHANSAVVLTSVKVILYLMNYIASAEFRESLCKKISPPLVTLLSSGPEVQYVALRNILLVIQRRPIVLQHDVKVFFCKYNDPIYVKMAKLEIMYRLASERNVEQVLAELREYAAEVDVDFVRKAVRSIGRLAIKIESTADRCIKVLLSLIQTKVNYVVQEAIVVIKDIFRKYPDRYESIISVLCENLDSLDEPEARAAMVWIIGQYAERIENSDELLEDFLFTFLDEPVEVQLALLTATVKLFLKRPAAGGELVPKVLKWATEEVENPDLRDRGYMYWRLLSTDPAAARDVVLSNKPAISTETDRMDRTLLDQLLLHGASLASIFHRQPQTFIRGSKARYLPDSPAIDEAAKKSASRHLYSRPTPRNPGGLANVQAETGARAAPPSALPPSTTDGAAATDDAPATPGALAHNGSSAPTASEGATAETNRSSDEVRRGDSADRPSGANGEAEEDPYAMLGDLGPEFGGVGGGYAADAPAPRSGVDDLLA